MQSIVCKCKHALCDTKGPKTNKSAFIGVYYQSRMNTQYPDTQYELMLMIPSSDV